MWRLTPYGDSVYIQFVSMCLYFGSWCSGWPVWFTGRSRRCSRGLICQRKSSWPAPSSWNTTRPSVVKTLSKRDGKFGCVLHLLKVMVWVFRAFRAHRPWKDLFWLECCLWLPGAVKAGWWAASSAATLWAGSSGWAWLRTRVRRCATGPGYSRAASSNTSNRNLTSKTVPFITASYPNAQGRGVPCGNRDRLVLFFSRRRPAGSARKIQIF